MDDPTTEAMDQAAHWYARLNGDAADTSRAGFEAWREASEQNARAWTAVERLYGRLDAAADSPELRAMIDAARGPRTEAPSHWPFLRMAASIALLATIGGAAIFGAGWLAEDPDATTVAVRYTTGVGERRSVTLADGTMMTLNTGSVVSLPQWKTVRGVQIEVGEVFFAVAKDPVRPFVVEAGGNRVTALGTRFSARRGEDRFEVALVEGKVRVDTLVEQGAHLLAPGNVLIADRRGTRISSSGADRATGWLKGQIVFDNTSLSSVVAEMNRYSKRKLVLGAPTLGGTPVSGVFRTGDIESLAHALEGYEIARISRRDKDQIVLNAF